jgi:hypothetical protein
MKNKYKKMNSFNYSTNGYNYEEKAFIDYMIGLNSSEIYGHSKSSFSYMLNGIKGTNNYYA